MIASISGTVEYHGVGFLIVERDGVGYKIILPEDVAHQFRDEVKFFTHEVIRDSERELFGFTSVDALELFWKLVAVSGVGPKSAQKIVFVGSIHDVKSNIMSGSLTFLTDVPGIGKKTAQKIILELKGVLADEPELMSLDRDAIEALVGLGYSRRDAEQALLDLEEESTEDLIRSALKRLAR